MWELPKVSERYAENPNVWNLSIVLAIGSLLWSLMAAFVSYQFDAHSVSEVSHPSIVSQLADIRSGQIKTQILAMDTLICAEPNNTYYRQELIELITQWEEINSPRKFPIQLLRCGK